ncbi:oxidative stress defense protein [Veronia pacifica]|uniref:Oxidative stress defense protein n=1 Tax=Veronia pacifica TaxID=1080227 RepID=A0A1C3EDN5_9GAMM|nr:oxidative stress defense protein [Veronia pacifica]ODA31345.1 oxidative stress defense protein [Veronia pacifica]
MKKTLLAALLSTQFLLSPLASAGDMDFAHIETMGVGEVSATPDMANVQVEVTTTERSAKEAKQVSDKAVASLLRRLEKNGVERKDIESANISLQPQYRYPKDSAPLLTGYRASRTVSIVITDLDNLNTVLDGALEDGINRINNISMQVSNLTALKEKAREAAIKDAIAKGESLAKGFGQKVKGVYKIRYFDSSPAYPMETRMLAMSADNRVDESYKGGQVKVEDRVEVIFKISED